MSLVNRMLRELDRRHAMGAAAQTPPGQVRPVGAEHRHEWFWRIVAVLVLIALAWVSWVGYQLRPRPPVATQLAFNAADRTKQRPAPSAAPQPAATPQPPPAPPKPAAVAPPPPAQAAAPAPTAPPAAAPPELLKLAQSIETPIPPAQPAAKAKPKPAKLPESLALRVSANPTLSKRDRPRSAEMDAEALFREGVGMLNQGRVSDAQQDFAAALKREPGHEGARQALVSVLIERSQLSQARRLLEEGLALNPSQAQFAAVLARILVEQRDYAGAGAVLTGAQEAGHNDAEYQVLFGAVLQRLGRHAEAAQALKRAVELKKQPAATWVALGVSLEASGRKSDALEAYRRSLVASAVTDDARSYAETRIRALR